jgi:uncharacterized glyoxalase superfamily protein PhnB
MAVRIDRNHRVRAGCRVGAMAVEGVTPILNVADIEASLAWFESLGWATDFTWPDDAEQAGFAAVTSGTHARLFLCRGAQGARGGPDPRFPGDDETGGVWVTWWVASRSEVDAMHTRALELGHKVSMAPTEEPWGVREFHLRHPDGHTFRVSCGLEE